MLALANIYLEILTAKTNNNLALRIRKTFVLNTLDSHLTER